MHSAKKIKKISLIIPVFNEQGRIHNLYKLWSFIKQREYMKELIVVNDGSTDNTRKLLNEFQMKTKCKVLSYRKNKGKGYAIKKGVEAAQGAYIVFMDVDLSTPPKMLSKLIGMKIKTDIIIGTRKNNHAILLKRQSRIRELMGAFFTSLSQKIMGVEISDFTCGFKCYVKKAAKKIFARQRVNRWAFDAESLFLARKYGFSTEELPVEWTDVGGTKVRFPQDAIQSLMDLFQIRLNDILGKY